MTIVLHVLFNPFQVGVGSEHEANAFDGKVVPKPIPDVAFVDSLKRVIQHDALVRSIKVGEVGEFHRVENGVS